MMALVTQGCGELGGGGGPAAGMDTTPVMVPRRVAGLAGKRVIGPEPVGAAEVATNIPLPLSCTD